MTWQRVEGEESDYFPNCETPETDPFLSLFERRGELDPVARVEIEGAADDLARDLESSLEDLVRDLRAGTIRSNRGPILRARSVDPTHLGITIGLRFLDGTTNQKQAVIEYAKEWTRKLRDHFRFVSSDSSKAIPVTFAKGRDKYWNGKLHLPSVRETNALQDKTSRRVVLHELGHVLGMSHEHLNPRFVVQWISAAEIAKKINEKYKPDDLWTEKQVKFNITDNRAPLDCPVGSGFDRTSIMCYPIDKDWTTNLSEGISWRYEISDRDVACVKSLYGLM